MREPALILEYAGWALLMALFSGFVLGCAAKTVATSAKASAAANGTPGLRVTWIPRTIIARAGHVQAHHGVRAKFADAIVK